MSSMGKATFVAICTLGVIQLVVGVAIVRSNVPWASSIWFAGAGLSCFFAASIWKDEHNANPR